MSEFKWQLVPVEPTEEMLNAGDQAAKEGGCDLYGLKRELSNGYAAMLAAAPQPPAHELLASLERFDSDGEDFVKLHDVRDVLAMIKQPPAHHAAPVATVNVEQPGNIEWLAEPTPDDGAMLYAKPQPPALGGELACWSCKKPFSLSDLAENDGCCPSCSVEIEMDDYVARLQAEVERLRGVVGKAHMALIGYLPGHRNDLTDAAIVACNAALTEGAKSVGEHDWGHQGIPGTSFQALNAKANAGDL